MDRVFLGYHEGIPIYKEEVKFSLAWFKERYNNLNDLDLQIENYRIMDEISLIKHHDTPGLVQISDAVIRCFKPKEEKEEKKIEWTLKRRLVDAKSNRRRKRLV